ncbi:uncharacterized protein LOC128747233 isoform X1 [Synchiropus splendidus]|uniref:uncharacterized protein LOC128747233 isoform X1 n=1 Tax=Synchiropus splendidus TaxID=270530 RepID=UPI00237EC898|nr:uncharacterized protein LOC128747233 isoform X1 [Synchiropus splendidus]
MKHLKPLSKYAMRMLKRSRERFTSPQRRYARRESLFSPDLGCVLDDPSPPEKRMRTSGHAFSLSMLKMPAIKFDFSVTAEVDGGYSEPDVLWDLGAPLTESSLCTSTPLKTKPVETLDSTLDKISSPQQSPVQKRPHGRRVLTDVCANNGPSILPVRQRRRNRVLKFKTEEQWNMKMYTHSVYRHITYSTEWDELDHLMTCVAQQGSGGRWKHPADLSCRYMVIFTITALIYITDLCSQFRNYAQRYGNNAPLKTLAEWASSAHKRFNSE